MNGTLNLNQAECLTTKQDWGRDIVTNLCNGNVQIVPWGTMDYVGTIGAIMVVIAVTAFVLGLLYICWRM